ncbi:hypothetical protein F0358_04885 [Empedobacter brevis]|uniref:Uncharacterized protein n=1 Tax=Empedobacter brevis NBRC 14943 = ATCC 43319 TaxID=1218108 RepID=A0A511NIL0_9FLAO|nr:hypothetical protein [Empedobacter brevis]QES92095.1 hypothetical protein F0358_04885 [Empedobacter brevis]QHC83882.1 hypothetical protein AS589_03285 [Empedobacter brevis]GEM52604.1 hypothetical protein EB1_23940 [Empedobacter brevis NBRC 14943 = ATCC 43319]
MSLYDYYNFPIQLVNGFLDDSKKVLIDISHYCIYRVFSDNFEKYSGSFAGYQKACDDFGVEFKNVATAYQNGKTLYDATIDKSPMVGMSSELYWDYMNNEKTDFEKVCLLGDLAFKSILGAKSYIKLDNKYWFSRMDGSVKSISKEELSPKLQRYLNEYQTKKIKNQLIANWGLASYSRYNRGFYVSYRMSLDDLAYHAEKIRKSTQDKKIKNDVKSAHEKAMERLEKESKIS